MSNFFIDHYLKHNLRNEISELYISVAIKNFAFSMIAIFEPVYLYKLYDSLSIVFFYYLVSYIIYFFAVPFGAKAAAKYGFEHCIFYSIPFAILYFLALSQLPSYGFLVVFAIIFLVFYKVLFWPSYHTDFAHYSSKGYKGRELGILSLISTVVTIIGPVIGGIILSKFGFETLFMVVSIISLISAIPLFITREKFEPHIFSYKKAFQRFLKPYNQYKRKNSIAYFGYGEEMIAAIAWPIFVFLLIEKFYLIGLLMSIVILLASISCLYVGKLSDTLEKKGRRKLFFSSTIFYALTWFLRPFAGNWLGILLVDFVSKGLRPGIYYPLLTFVYTGGGNNRGFLKYTIFYEMSLTLGKTLVIFVALILALCLDGSDFFWFVLFGFTGLWTLIFLSAYKK
ncbi:MAG: MFS transporter [Candidatus Pacebacteria bacterium]|nr:MFS transporter [Candidatus Paceibacterota bacterium]